MIFRTVLENDLKENSMNSNIDLFCSPLLKAHKQEFLPSYPSEDIKKLKEPPVQIDPFSFDKLRHWLYILRTKASEWHDMILFWSRTGLRPGELYALK